MNEGEEQNKRQGRTKEKMKAEKRRSAAIAAGWLYVQYLQSELKVCGREYENY